METAQPISLLDMHTCMQVFVQEPVKFHFLWSQPPTPFYWNRPMTTQVTISGIFRAINFSSNTERAVTLSNTSWCYSFRYPNYNDVLITST